MATEKAVMGVLRASRPTFRDALDKMVFAVNACFLSAGFALHATGLVAASHDALFSPSTDEVPMDGWNEVSEDKEFSDHRYAFLYSDPDKGSKKVVVKCIIIGNKLLLVDALSDGAGDEHVYLAIRVEDYDGEKGGPNYGSQYKNLGKLVSNVNNKILTKLYGASADSPSSQPSSSGYVGVPGYQSPTIPYPTVSVHGFPPVNPVDGSVMFPAPGLSPLAMYHPTTPRYADWFPPVNPIPVDGSVSFPVPGLGPGPGPGPLGMYPIRGDLAPRFGPHGHRPPRVPGFEPNQFNREIVIYPGLPGAGGILGDLPATSFDPTLPIPPRYPRFEADRFVISNPRRPGST